MDSSMMQWAMCMAQLHPIGSTLRNGVRYSPLRTRWPATVEPIMEVYCESMGVRVNVCQVGGHLNDVKEIAMSPEVV